MLHQNQRSGDGLLRPTESFVELRVRPQIENAARARMTSSALLGTPMSPVGSTKVGASMDTMSNQLQTERSSRLRPPLSGGAARGGVSRRAADHGLECRVTYGVSYADVVKWLADASSPAQTAGGRPNQIEDQCG